MKQELVSVSLPGDRTQALFIDDASSLLELLSRLLDEEPGNIEAVGDGASAEDSDRSRWAIQRVLASDSNRQWTDDELLGLGDGTLCAIARG